MSDTNEGKGSCLCGDVRFTARSMSLHVGACHCSMCRKWGGGPFMEVDCADEVVFEGEENISVYRSSKWADRGFCQKCGSHLFYKLIENNQHMMPVGLFDDDHNYVFDQQVFIDEKPSFYTFANKTSDMTGPELFAKYAPPQ